VSNRIIDAITGAEIPAVADTAYQGAGPTVAVLQRRRRLDPDTGPTGGSPGCRRRSTPPTPAGAAQVAGQPRTEELAHPAQDLFLPEPRRRTRRRSSNPHDRQRMIKLAKAGPGAAANHPGLRAGRVRLSKVRRNETGQHDQRVLSRLN
jgi:hypothetical protein